MKRDMLKGCLGVALFALLSACGGNVGSLDSGPVEDSSADTVIQIESSTDAAEDITDAGSCKWVCIIGAPYWYNTCTMQKCFDPAIMNGICPMIDASNPCPETD